MIILDLFYSFSIVEKQAGYKETFMRILFASGAVLLLSVCLYSDAFAFKSYRDNQGLFRRGCYMDNSRYFADEGQVCGRCRNTGHTVCCNAFSETNAYSCGVSEQQGAAGGGSGTGKSVSEAVAKACGCF